MNPDPPPSGPVPGSAISALMVSFQTGPILWQALNAALAEPMIGEIWLVDNGNAPGVLTRLESLARAEPRLRLLAGEGNIGFGRACNLAAARAGGDLILLLNPDLLIQPGAAAQMLGALAQAKSPAIIGGRILGKDGQEQRGARRDRLTPWTALVAVSGMGRLERLHKLFRDPHREKDPLPDAPISVGAVSGAFLMMRRADYLALGGFDPAFFLHVEDVDLCARAKAAGGDVVFQPSAIGMHSGASSQASSLFIERHKARGFALLFARHAQTPWERLGGMAVAALLGIAFTLRGVARDWRKRGWRANAPAASSSSPPH